MELPKLSPYERIILIELTHRDNVAMSRIIHAVYGNQIHTIDAPEASFRVMLSRMRKKLAPFGIRIELVARGYHSTSYYAIRGVERAAIRDALAAFFGPEILRKAA
jgi:hypothetical protein